MQSDKEKEFDLLSNYILCDKGKCITFQKYLGRINAAHAVKWVLSRHKLYLK